MFDGHIHYNGDAWASARWKVLPELMDGVREWLGELPRGVAAKISRTNAERLFPVR